MNVNKPLATVSIIISVLETQGKEITLGVSFGCDLSLVLG